MVKATAVGLNISDIFVGGVYPGSAKPKQFVNFMRPHIEELKVLTREVNFNGRSMKVMLENYICDAPARASVTGTKGHSGYFGCSKCVQEGEFDNRMLFPEINLL